MRAGRDGFTLLEILMAVGILAFCFVPILTHSRATVQETETAQEDILARHFLMDLVERYKGASIAELQTLNGKSSADLLNDSLLSDTTQICHEMEALAAQSGAQGAQALSGSISGLQKFVDLKTMLKFDLAATFDQPPFVSQPGAHLLTCTIHYQGRAHKGPKTLTVSKVIVRDT